MMHPYADAMEQSTPPSETQPPDGDFATGAWAGWGNGDLKEGVYEDGEGEIEGEEEGEDITDEELEENLGRIEGLLGNKNFLSQLEANEKIQQEFLMEFDIYLGMRPPEKMDNAFHFMARKRFPSPFLIRHMLSNHKKRMDDKDDAQRRPLTLSIEKNNEVFITTVLESQYDDADLERILGLKSSDAGNGIHKAIRDGLSPKLTIDLINKVSNKVLKDVDGEGCTPLHRAVEYKRCTEAQLNVVKALLERGDSALDKRNKAGLSIYQYHFSTRPKESSTAAKAFPNPKVRPDRATTSSQPQNPSQLVGGKIGDEMGKKALYEKEDIKKKGEEAHNGFSLDQRPNMGPGPGFRRTPTFKQEDETEYGVPKPLINTNNQANISRKTTSAPQPATTKTQLEILKETPPTASKVTRNSNRKKWSKTTTRKAVKDVPPVSKVFADEIANEVKLQYLRSTFTNDQRNHDTAVEFLYPDNQMKHICFNLLQNYKPMSKKSLTVGSYSRFEFDTALQFVAVGPIAIEKQGEPVASQRQRRDMLTLFEWLKDKKVNNIVKVVVNDHKDPFHSDKAIIDALKQFNIEILDWSKPDLCPETIRAACNDVRELYLSWSGLNGMLLAWGGTDGLANLPNLTDVYLRQISNSESEEWTIEKLNDFEKRLKNTRDWLRAKQKAETLNSQSEDQLTDLPRITVHRPKVQPKVDNQPIADGVGQEQNKQTPIKDHQWLEYMDRFSSGIFTLPPDEEYIKSVPNLPAELRRDVRICLIDDGVDILHKSITERIEDGGRAFGAYTRDEYRGMARPFYNSTTNHGTLMANMMVRVCPFAKIASYRLDTRRGEDNRVHFTAKSAADALEYAIKQDFDIISMSWTVREETGPEEDNTADITRIKNALREATAKKKLVFCSAPDTGDISPDELSSYFPVGSGIQELFRIGAAKADNTPWPQLVKGDEVIQNNKSLKSGSSIATALAAGLAALMIHVVRMAAIRTYELKKENEIEANLIKLISLKTIKSPGTMRKTFDSMTTDKMYVHVWGNFYRKGNELKAADDAEDSKAEKWRIIAELARDIVSSQNTDQ
ncbi:hypothetical protein E0Z10_g1618 [Xylaria hypoxylon]|uniref:Peptidase S8/S53 domain-containing protein n=1 Tax=Xylaria hypoxylon TaxID=37992 RepID=A0A4Z0Z6Q0_9PEZI|nr:hypothetical protein E0Z10_g1618 [Xylaria hypoxylon]